MCQVLKTSLKVSVAGIFLLAWCSSSRAQVSSPPKTQTHVLKVDVDLVLVSVIVTGPHGRAVTGLEPEHFRVWEDKVEQKIEYVSQQEEPLSAGIIFDTSNSMQDKISRARDAAAAFLRSGNSQDEYFLVEFNSKPNLSENFTTDTTRFQNHFISTPVRGMTALFDAVYLGLERLKGHSNRRKALLLITDGEDNHSRYTFAEIKEFVKEQDVQIFAIGTLDFGSWLHNGRTVIENLVGITGGRAFFPNSINQLEDISTEIGAELKSEYILGYRSTNQARDGKWRKIHVKVEPPKGMPRLSVRARSGYYASSSETSP